MFYDNCEKECLRQTEIPISNLNKNALTLPIFYTIIYDRWKSNMQGRLNSAVHITIKLTFNEIPTRNQDLLSKPRSNVRS
jgi:hypothetical protein